MTTAAPARALTPQLKAPPTAGSSSESAVAVNTSRPAPSRTPPPPAQQQAVANNAASSAPPMRRAGRSAAGIVSDPLSDRVTANLIRRTLCGQQLNDKDRLAPTPIEELLPPLTSRNDVDLQLYAILAIVLREYVQKWYDKITPDETFVAEIVQIIAHCTRALEQRLRKVDLESLLFDELPELLDRHIQAHRTAHHPSVQAPVEVNPRQIYHSLCPLPALSPVPELADPPSVVEQERNEAAYRQLLVNGVLAVLLPTEDLENECLTALVGQILSELIIGGVIAKKASEPWLLYEGLAILARVFSGKSKTVPAAVSKTNQAEHASVPQSTRPATRASSGSSIQQLFWAVLQGVFAGFALLRFLVLAITMSSSAPSRLAGNEKSTTQKTESGFHDPVSRRFETQTASAKVPVVAFRVWPTMSNLLEIDLRMPWLSGTASMLQWLAMTGPGRLAGFDGVLDRLLSDAIHKHVLNPAKLPPLLRTLRGALFPNNAPGVSSLVAPASDAEFLALRHRSAAALLELVPGPVGAVLFGRRRKRDDRSPVSGRSTARARSGDGLHQDTTESLLLRSGPVTGGGGGGLPGAAAGRGEKAPLAPGPSAAGETDDADLESEEQQRIIGEIEEDILAVLGDVYCNKHLMYSALELILVRLMPELAERGAGELWEERLS